MKRKAQLASRRRQSLLGLAKGDFVVPDDFDDPLPKEVEDEFYKVDDLLAESLSALHAAMMKEKRSRRRRQ